MRFERGEIILPPGSKTAHALYGACYEAYQAMEHGAAVLGHPTSDLYVDGEIRRVDFERGWIEQVEGQRANIHVD